MVKMTAVLSGVVLRRAANINQKNSTKVALIKLYLQKSAKLGRGIFCRKRTRARKRALARTKRQQVSSNGSQRGVMALTTVKEVDTRKAEISMAPCTLNCLVGVAFSV